MELSNNNIYSRGTVRYFQKKLFKINPVLTRNQVNYSSSNGNWRRYFKGTLLTTIAFEEYGDDKLWYIIADANNIQGPRLDKTANIFIPIINE